MWTALIYAENTPTWVLAQNLLLELIASEIARDVSGLMINSDITNAEKHLKSKQGCRCNICLMSGGLLNTVYSYGFPLVFGNRDSGKGKKKITEAAALMLNVPVFTNNFQKLVYICLKPWVIAREIHELDSSCENAYICMFVTYYAEPLSK